MVMLTTLPTAPLDKGSKLEELVRGIRTRKGLKVSLDFRLIWYESNPLL